MTPTRRPQRLLGLALALALGVGSAWAQAPTPLAAVRELFDAMRAADSGRVARLFHPRAQFFSIQASPQGNRVTLIPPGDFARAVGGWEPGFADERLGRAAVQRDGPLATVWARYHFYAEGALHHCGAETFTLVEVTPAQWQILNGVDTRQTTEACDALDDAATLAALDSLMDRWHRAAATADEDRFFGTMAADGVYLGTDATERWLRDAMALWAAPYFQRETAWAFTPRERHWQLSDDGETAWFDEHLDSWMGVVRGSGVLTKVDDDDDDDDDGNASTEAPVGKTADPPGARAADATPAGTTRWALRHYNLALTVPNERMDAVRVAIDSTAVPRG